jgi:ribosomal protein S18 acetylase RimI-like enzyme
MALLVRPWTQDDTEALASLGVCEPEASGTVLVAERGSEIFGAVALEARPFEEEHLGRVVRHITALAGTAQLVLSQSVVAHAQSNNVDLVTVRLPEVEVDALSALQSCGFQVVECLMTLRRDLSRASPAAPDNVDLATVEDADAVATVSAGCFSENRFHIDPRIDNACADGLKAAWARNAVLGRADATFVTRDASGRPTGFNACLVRGERAIIDLIGVSPQHQGQGLGRRLVAAAVHYYAGRSLKYLDVGTQSRNIASLNLYTKLGFRPLHSALTLHWHRT